MTQPLSIDVFWSFRSPWSYLATPRLRQWQQDYELKVNLRPVYPIAIRTPEFFQQVNPMWFNYFMTDVFRVADYLELPFVWPNPDPVVQVIDERGQRRTHPEQPYIHRLTRLGVAAAERGRALEFADEVSRLIWVARRIGITATIWRSPQQRPVLIWPIWIPPSRNTKRVWRRRLPRISKHMSGQATGESRPLRSTANPSSGKTGWMCCYGALSKAD